MKEHPILFSAPMVRAILEGRKTQTRRVVKGTALEWLQTGMFTPAYTADPENHLCPYGQPGDRLWVRETWRYADWTSDGYPWVEYQADASTILHDQNLPPEWSSRIIDIWAELSTEENFAIDGRAADRKWRPSIHMPRWASRITLEVTGVRVERLHNISEVDAIAEGVQPAKPLDPHSGKPLDHVQFERPHIVGFAGLWNEINGAGSWDANPWVWVIAFKRLEKKQ